MTSTATVSCTSTKSANLVRRSSSILLTPSKDVKRRKLDEHPVAPSSMVPQHSPTRNDDAGDPSTSASLPAEVWRWTLTRDAVARCFVKDVLDMRDSGHKEMEYFWLGRIPCRTVELVGVLVGIQAFEQRIIYTLDDGSAVIDCNHKVILQAVSPRKSNVPDSKTGRIRQASNSSSAYASARTSAQPSTSKAASLLPLPPKPIADIGAPVRVIGRVVETSKGRHVLVDEIRPCLSPNDEPNHWTSVLELHRTRYFAENLGPFVVPPQKRRAPPSWIPKSPEKGKGKAKATDTSTVPGKSDEAGTGFIEPQTPSSVGSVSTDGSPASAASLSSRHSRRQSPVRLRHPTRLHRRELTANTFRIYLKHYMDNAPPPDGHGSDSAISSRSASPTPLPRSQPRSGLGHVNASLATPRKQSTVSATADASDDRTPRPSQLRARLGEVEREHECTPRAARPSARSTDPHEPESSSSGLYGFTLSHLRRVPELTILARRVVDEEGRRRVKEEREQKKADATQAKGKQRQVHSGRSSEPRAKKMKRLFQFAIRQLYQEGSIVLWDGPIRPLPREDTVSTQLSGPLWRANSSSASAMSTLSTVSSVAPGDEDSGQLSEPSPGEEAYISLTPKVLAGIAECAIREFMAAGAARRHKQHGHSRANVDPSAPFAPAAPPPGPSTAEIAGWLHRDARWARVGEWAVKDALEWARAEGRVWCIGHGRWELCG
ncbi:hypothetical protein DAEQUDRAFT_814359 [Daedalea quercina L-15889]|uniref:CST complex subunit STN1 n=1 Tax=Daedalea quercina L-15889 TaxID=1314783 RepID=A0A165M6G6_9APHY|nr:hypothetical protein DAEQUDRAFT_814359 [Daedalea quercina L-15889]